MSSWFSKIMDFIKGHPDQAASGLDKAEELINEHTGGKYTEQIDQGADAVRDQLGLPADADPAATPRSTPVPPPAPSPPTTPAPAPAPVPAPEPSPSEIPPGTEPASEPDLPGVPNPNLPEPGAGTAGDVTLGDPPKNA